MSLSIPPLEFLVIWSICLISFPNNFYNSPENFIWGIVKLLMRLLLWSLVSRCFLLLRNFFSYFFFHPLFALLCCCPTFPDIGNFSFSWLFWCFPDLIVRLIQLFSFSPFLIISITHFSIPNSIPISFLSIMILCANVSRSSFVFSKYPNTIHVHEVVYLSDDWVKFWRPMHCLNI